ncbi:hypothetical protein E2I00_005333, partial [Balaenoptera physalus]
PCHCYNRVNPDAQLVTGQDRQLQPLAFHEPPGPGARLLCGSGPGPARECSGLHLRVSMTKEAPNISREVVKQLLPKAPPLQQILDLHDFQGDALQPEDFLEEDDPKVMFTKVLKAQLWVYLRPVPRPATVYLQILRLKPLTGEGTAGGGGGGRRHIRIRSLKIDLHSRSGHWQSIDFKQVLHSWFRQPQSNWGIEINAFDPSGTDLAVTSLGPGAEGLHPFMELRVLENTKRSRRNLGLDCDEHSSESRCCRYPLTVDFEAFGWDWIIAPKRYKANYCSGQCEYMFMQKYPHTHLVQQANPRGSAGPCCTPTKISGWGKGSEGRGKSVACLCPNSPQPRERPKSLWNASAPSLYLQVNKKKSRESPESPGLGRTAAILTPSLSSLALFFIIPYAPILENKIHVTINTIHISLVERKEQRSEEQKTPPPRANARVS